VLPITVAGPYRQARHHVSRYVEATASRDVTGITETHSLVRHSGIVSDDDRQPIDDVLPGFKLHPLSPGSTPLQAFVLVKSLDQDGQSAWSFRTSEPMNLEELLGALVVQVNVLKRKLTNYWDDTDGEDG
jgi:hypothetical protein